MAFCRFVNGFVDRDVAKAALRANGAPNTIASATNEERGDGGVGDGAITLTATARGESSMYAHAVAIGMPERFVDLRHQATHDEMPSLEVLTQMAKKGLEWLWERWWKVNATDDPGMALREREERRLLGVKKTETRRLSAQREGMPGEDEPDVGAGATDLNGELSLRVDQVTNESGQADMLCLSCRKRKRKRGPEDEEEVEVKVRQGQEPGKEGKLASARARNAISRSSFGLFER